MLLRNGICPSRAQWLKHEPSFREFASFDPVDLQGARLARFRIRPLEREAEACAVALERMIIHNEL